MEIFDIQIDEKNLIFLKKNIAIFCVKFPTLFSDTLTLNATSGLAMSLLANIAVIHIIFYLSSGFLANNMSSNSYRINWQISAFLEPGTDESD